MLQGRRPQAQIRAISDDMMQFYPGTPRAIEGEAFHQVFEWPSGSAPGPGGCTNEMLRVCLDDAEVLQFASVGSGGFCTG